MNMPCFLVYINIAATLPFTNNFRLAKRTKHYWCEYIVMLFECKVNLDSPNFGATFWALIKASTHFSISPRLLKANWYMSGVCWAITTSITIIERGISRIKVAWRGKTLAYKIQYSNSEMKSTKSVEQNKETYMIFVREKVKGIVFVLKEHNSIFE